MKGQLIQFLYYSTGIFAGVYSWHFIHMVTSIQELWTKKCEEAELYQLKRFNLDPAVYKLECTEDGTVHLAYRT
jgi:hypothetical protein